MARTDTAARARPRVGLVGSGTWGRLILRDLVSLGCDVWAVARSDRSVSNAREHGAHCIVAGVAELPRDLDGYVVAAPTSVHAQIVTELLERQRPIYVEKPLCNDPEDAARLAREGNGRVFVMDKWRYHPGIRVLADIAASGELGTVRSIHSYRLGWGLTHDDVDVTWVLLPHDLSIALHILGQLEEPLWAAAEVDPDGQVSGFQLGLRGSPSVNCEVSSNAAVDLRSVQVHFEKGAAAMHGSYSEHVLVRRGAGLRARRGGEVEKRPIGNEMPLLSELRAFVDHLHGGPPPFSSVAEGARIVGIIAQARTLAGLSD